MQNLRSIRWVFFLLLLCAGSFSCNRPELEHAEEKGNLCVLFTDESGTPLQLVLIGVGSNDYIHQNGDDGSLLLERLAVGVVRLFVHCDGFVDAIFRFDVEADKTVYYTAVLKKEPSYIRIKDGSPAIFETSKTKGRNSVRLESNWDWWVEDDPGEMTIETRSGKGDTFLYYSWDFPENLFAGDTLMRSFRVLSQDDTLTLKLVLHVPIRIESWDAFDRNAADGDGGVILDLHFSRPVTNVRQMHQAGWEIRKATPVDKEYRSYSFNLGEGGDYKGSVLVEAESLNRDGVTFRDSIPFLIGDSFRTVEGRMTATCLSADENWMWIAMKSPDRVCKMDMHTLDILTQFDLSFPPDGMAYNYYNDCLYLINQAGRLIVVLDAETGHQQKIIRVRDKPFVDPSKYPFQLHFADNGLGLLLTKDDNGKRYWRILDSRKNDEMSFPDMEQMAGSDDAGWQLSQVCLDHTRNRFLGLSDSPSRYVYCFNALDGSYSTFQLPVTLENGEVCMRFTQMTYFRPCRLRNQVLICAQSGLSILNLDDDSFTPPFKTNTWGVSGDFCGGQAAGDIRSFVLDNGTLQLVDNTKAEILFKSSIRFRQVLNLLAFSSGDRILLIKDTEMFNNTEFIVFNTHRFNP